MSAGEPRFVMARDAKDGYGWSPRSAWGETLEPSERAHSRQECERDLYRCNNDRYPHAKARDAAVG